MYITRLISSEATKKKPHTINHGVGVVRDLGNRGGEVDGVKEEGVEGVKEEVG